MKDNRFMGQKDLYYTIAELNLQIILPSDFDKDLVLSSFEQFEINPSEANQIIAVIEVVNHSLDLDLNEGKLLSNESIFWGDRFKFFEFDDAYHAILQTEDLNHYCKMICNKDFSKVKIEYPGHQYFKEDVLSWLLMVVFAQASLLHSTILLHASVVEDGDVAFAFLGKSGTGKSTHSRLWLTNFSEFQLLNDDNPAIRRLSDQQVYVYGTPWSGKTPCYRNVKRKLKGIVRLQQGASNEYVNQANKDKLIALLPSCSAIRWNPQLFSAMTAVVVQVANEVPVGLLKNLPNNEAAKLCYENINHTKLA